jgi:geranylgeranyl pyrophosphate synthase
VALAGLSPEKRTRLESLVNDLPLAEDRLREIRRLYEEAGAFQQAARLVEKHQQRAETIAAQIEPEPLRQLFYYLIEMVLQRRQM